MLRLQCLESSGCRRTVQRGTDTSWWWLGVAVAVLDARLLAWPQSQKPWFLQFAWLILLIF